MSKIEYIPSQARAYFTFFVQTSALADIVVPLFSAMLKKRNSGQNVFVVHYPIETSIDS